MKNEVFDADHTVTAESDNEKWITTHIYFVNWKSSKHTNKNFHFFGLVLTIVQYRGTIADGAAALSKYLECCYYHSGVGIYNTGSQMPYSLISFVFIFSISHIRDDRYELNYRTHYVNSLNCSEKLATESYTVWK